MILERFIHVQIYNSAGTSVQYDNRTDTGWGITAGTMKLDKILMSKEVSFGELNSAKFECQIYGLDIDLSNRKIKVEAIETTYESIYLVDENANYIVTKDDDFITFETGATETPTLLFAGWVESSTNDYFSTDRNIVAYDWFYFHRKDNIAEFWNTFWTGKETATLASVRNALMTNMGLSFADSVVTGINDTLSVKNMFSANIETLPFDSVFTSIMQLQCWALYMADFNVIQLVTLPTTSAFNVSDNTEKANSTWENYVTEAITGVGVYDSGSYLAQSYGTTDNMLKIVNNLFLLDMTAEQINSACQPILNAVSGNGIKYKPTTIKCIISNFAYKLGDRIQTEQGYTYIMNMSLSGSLLVEQTIQGVANGPVLSSDLDEFNDSMVEGNKYARLTKNIDEFKIEYGNYKEQVATEFSMTNRSITLKVDSNGNIGTCELGADPDDGLTYFRLNTDHIQFVANKSLDLASADLSITSDHFSVDTEGNVTATNVNLTGNINATTGSIGGFTIDNGALTSSYIDIDPTGGIALKTLFPTMASIQLDLSAGAVSLLPYINLWVDYQTSGGLNPQYVGSLKLNNSLLLNQRDELIATPDDITMKHIVHDPDTEEDTYDGWGGSIYTSLDDAMNKLLVYQRVQADTEYTRTAQYCYGFVTDNATELHLFVPMKLAFDIPNDTSVYITSCTASIRLAEGGYAGNLGNDGNYLPYYDSGVASQVQGGLRLKFKSASSMGGVWANTNNTPVTGLITFTFAIRNYNWYSAEGGTLVVREKISDGSFRWYFNDYDASQNGRIDYETSWRHFVPTRLRKFAKCPEGAPPWYDTQQREYNYDIVQGTNKYPGASSWFGFEWQKTDYPTTPIILGYHTEYLYQGMIRGIIESTDFALTPLYYAGGASSSIARRSDHSWIEPTFDPING